MNNKDFCYWLQDYVNLHNEERWMIIPQWETIKKHLSTYNRQIFDDEDKFTKLINMLVGFRFILGTGTPTKGEWKNIVAAISSTVLADPRPNISDGVRYWKYTGNNRNMEHTTAYISKILQRKWNTNLSPHKHIQQTQLPPTAPRDMYSSQEICWVI